MDSGRKDFGEIQTALKEIRLTETRRDDQVIVEISRGQVASSSRQANDLKLHLTEIHRQQRPLTKYSPSPYRSLKAPTDNYLGLRRRSIARSPFQKPKTRFAEPYIPSTIVKEENDQHIPALANHSPGKSTPNEPISPTTPGDEEESKSIRFSPLRLLLWIELIAFVCITGFLLASLTLHSMQHIIIFSLKIWKWSVVLLTVICGRLITELFVQFGMFFVERSSVLELKVRYFIYEVRNSVRNFIWLCLILCTWVLLINHRDKRSRNTGKVLKMDSKVLVCLVIGALIFLIKTLLIKVIDTSLSCFTYYDRINESLFNQYLLHTLSGPPLCDGQTYFEDTSSSKELGVDLLDKMNNRDISAAVLKKLTYIIRNSAMSTQETEQQEIVVWSEQDAKAAAKQAFRYVAKPGSNYIEQDDCERFFSKSKTTHILPLFEGGAVTGKISKSAFKNWVVNAFRERRALALSITDATEAVKMLNYIITPILIVVIAIAWILILEIVTTQMFVFIIALMIMVAFMFGNTAKTAFEAVMFVFVRHPFDTGDRVVIKGVTMVVEEMSLLTTVFLRYDNEKIYYPNSILATKSISNLYRSPDMGDSIEFSIDFSTPDEIIEAMKARIKTYIENKPQHWYPNPLVVVKEIENMNKMKMALYPHHTMNYQDYGEILIRRTKLQEEMKKIFQELSITYHLLPQEVNLKYVGSPVTVLTGH